MKRRSASGNDTLHGPSGRCEARLAHRGLSLIEVLVALAILALVAAATASALSGAVERARFRAAAREIASALRAARYSAMSKQVEATFALDVERKTYVVSDGRGRELGLPKDSVVTLSTASSEELTDTSGTIRFFSDGSSTGGAVTIVLRDRQDRIAVHWLTGRIEVGSE
jgi:general secretion pathway protein H